MAEFEFVFPRAADSVLITKCKKALTPHVEHISAVRAFFRTGGSFEELELPEFRRGERLKTVASLGVDVIQRMEVHFHNGLKITLSRDDGMAHLDKCRFASTGAPEHLEPVLFPVFAALRKDLGGFHPERGLSELLSEDARRIVEVREDVISRLEQTNLRITEEMEEFRRRQEEEFSARKADLERQFAADREAQERLYASKEESLLDRENAFQKLREELDDRQSRHARRELRKDFKLQLKTYAETFEVTEGTRNLRRVVFWTCISMMVLLGILAVAHLTIGLQIVGGSDGSPSIPVLVTLAVKQVVLWGGFIGISTFFIRWNNDWFRQHAEEEFRLKRLGLDFDRASWVVEMATEWKEVAKGEELPPELLDRLTRNLFVENTATEGDVTAADHLASAILGASANATLQTPGGSLTLDRKGLSRLRKESAG